MVGRSVDQVFPEASRSSSGADSPDGRRLLPSDRIRRYRLFAAQGRNPWLLWPCRRGPQRVHAGAVRHHQAVEGRGHASTARSPSSARPPRPSPRGIVYVPEERGKQGVVDRPADLPEHHRCRRWAGPRSNGFLRLAEEFALAREYADTARSARRFARARMPALCPAATSRRSSSPNGWRRSRASSFSTNRPRASTSARRPPCMNS